MHLDNASASFATSSPPPTDNGQVSSGPSQHSSDSNGGSLANAVGSRPLMSPKSMRATSERMAAQSYKDPDPSAVKRSTSAQHTKRDNGPGPTTSMSSPSTKSNQSNTELKVPPASHRTNGQEGHRGLHDTLTDVQFVSQTRSISTSKSLNSFAHHDADAPPRPRSKSTASSCRSSPMTASVTHQPSTTQLTGSKEVHSSSKQPSQALSSAPSKLNLRSRIFGLKSSKAVSPSASPHDSGPETPSPRSSQFATSIRSEGSHSDSNPLEHSDSQSLEPALPSPAPTEPSIGHGRDDDDDSGDASNADPRSIASTTRKSSAASSFLRKTIRFKDKSAFLKTRPSVSSLTSDSAASASMSVPPSPANPSNASDAEDTKKPSVYKQVSGRRGLQYRESEGDSTIPTSRHFNERSQINSPSNGLAEHDVTSLLPAVTERELEGSVGLQQSPSSTTVAGSGCDQRSSSSSQLQPNAPGTVTCDVRPSYGPVASPVKPGLRSHIPRSSSLQGSTSRGKLTGSSPSQTLVDRSESSSAFTSEMVDSPRRRPRSGSANTFAPQIQPRTTSSPGQSSARRPVTAQGSPSLTSSSYATPPSSAHRPAQRTSRPKTADSGHGYSGSLSSLRDILMVAHAISEEGAIYNTPDKPSVSRFQPTSGTGSPSKPAASPGDSRRPGLPPKNPLRKQRPSTASVTNTPSASGDSPASVHTSGVFPGFAIGTADDDLLGPESQFRQSTGPVSASNFERLLPDYRNATSNPAQARPVDRQGADDYSRDLSRQRDLPARSFELQQGAHGGSPSPVHSTFVASAQHLSRAHSSDSTAGWTPRRHERTVSDATNSLTDLGITAGPGASTPSLHSESSSTTRRKKEGAGSKMLAFARDLKHRDQGDLNATIPSSGTFRLGRSSKTKKGDHSTRPVIRRLYDGPLEGDAAALALDQQADTSHTYSHFTDGVSPGTSVTDLNSPAVGGPRTPGSASTPAMGGRHASSGSLIRSASSSGSTAKDLLSPASTHMPTPQFGRNGSGPLLTRSSSFIKPTWSIPQDDLTQEQKRLVKRWFVLRELLETERAYASDLAVARDIYLARAKVMAGITAPLSPLSLRSASIFSQLASPEPSTLGRSAQPHLQQRGSASAISPGPATPSGRGPLPQRTLFRNASADSAPNATSASPSSADQTASSASLTASNPSNRSSMYTVSSQSSQTSDASQFAFAGHPTFAAGLPSQFSLDGNTLSPTTGLKLPPGTPMTLPSPGLSSTSSTPATPVISHSSGVLPPGLAGSNEGTAASTPEGPFSASDVRIIFAQLESCAAFADEMVAVLETAVGKICNGTAEEASQLLARGEVYEEDEPDRVGQAFLKLMPRIEQVYSGYCSRHEASMSRLQDLLSSQPKVAAFINECTQVARAYTNAWDLSSLLIKPVQRVLKYPLLLSQILASTSSKHPDMDSLAAASVEIQKVADNINEVKKRKDLVEQIVSGKSAKRTTSQRMQHGATKKLLRRQEKVKQLVLGPADDVLADDEQYKALVVQFRQLEKAVATFARRCTLWSTSVRDAHVAQIRLLDRWCCTYAVDEVTAGTEAESRVRAFMHLVERTFLSGFWTQLDSEIRTSMTPALQRIAALFVLPQSVIAKRNDREPEYTRYRSEITRGGPKPADKKLTESATAFIALHTQLMNELPQFNYGVQTLLDLCIESLSRTQASYYLRVHRALIDFWQSFGPESNSDIIQNEETDERSMRHLNPVKIFWPLHSNVAGFAESLGIVSGVDDPSRSTSISLDSDLLGVDNLGTASNNHFSPLQSTRMLADPEFASRVPDASTMSQQIESLTAANAEELLEPLSSRASPFTTPPLGSRRPSISPQLHQQPLLGSPAPIGSVALSGSSSHSSSANPPPPLRSVKSGGLIGLLRSVGSSSAVGSRKNSQSTDAHGESFVEEAASSPPTPISKDTPLLTEPATSSEAAGPPPTLPALSFNSGFFGQSDAVFSSTQAHGLGVDTAERSASTGDDATVRANQPSATPSSRPSLPAGTGTMAAVANSALAPNGSKNGHPFIEYAVGDLFRVTDSDGAFLFGCSEHGATGWVERENFVPLS